MHGHLHRGTPLTCKDLRGLCGEERSAECKNRCAIGRYSATTHPIQNAYTSCAEIAYADEILPGIGAVMHHPSPFANTRSHPIDARISGTVVDAHDRPVANAIVYAEEQIAPFGDAYRIQATTDRSGHFDFGQGSNTACSRCTQEKKGTGIQIPILRSIDLQTSALRRCSCSASDPSQRLL